MSHLDEGTLHALLDGELDLTEVSEIQLHLGSCVACGSRLQEVKQVLAEADRLVGAVEMPAGGAARRTGTPVELPARPVAEPDISDETPVLLLAESPDAYARRERWKRGLRWAAAIVLVLGGGRIISNTLRPGRPMLPERDLTSASPTVPPAVVSREERQVLGSPATPTRGKLAQRPPQSVPANKKSSIKPPVLAEQKTGDSSRDLADTAAPKNEDSLTTDSQVVATSGAVDSGTELATIQSADSVGSTQSAQKAAADQARRDEVDREGAAAALARLDQERLRERANAATAALPPTRAQQTVTAAPEVAAAPRTLEQRAQVYLRIGLDEAANQLGRPVHVIEGMSPQFIGLTRQPVPGADSTRPVVRVVYLDSRGRMILLDQQRIRPGSPAPAAASGSLRWAVGDVLLYLRGEPSGDVLRSLQERVR
jgi:putative zinc finger protein